MSGPLRRVVERTPTRFGMRDYLECGHDVAFDGVRTQRRRCVRCPPDPPPEDRQLPLFAEPLDTG